MLIFHYLLFVAFPIEATTVGSKCRNTSEVVKIANPELS